MKQRLPAQKGFTLLELLIVLSIIALIVGVMFPNLSVTDNSAFNAEVRKAAATMNYARRMSIVQAAPTVAEFRTDISDDDIADARGEPEQAAGLQNARHSLWSSTDITLGFQDEFQQAPIDTSRIALTFFPQGGSTGGTLYFTRDERRAMIRVDPITGRIATAYNGEEFDDEFPAN